MVLISSICFFFSVGQSCAEDSDPYVCKQVESTVESQADDIARKLNSMGCDTEAPFTVNIYPNSKYAMVCCAHKRPRGILPVSKKNEAGSD